MPKTLKNKMVSGNPRPYSMCLCVWRERKREREREKQIPIYGSVFQVHSFFTSPHQNFAIISVLPMRAICPANLLLLALITLIIVSNKYRPRNS